MSRPEGAGREGSLWSPAVARWCAPSLPPRLCDVLATMAQEADAQRQQEGRRTSFGRQVFRLGLALGLPSALCRRCGVFLDGLSLLFDITDNLADEAEDIARGRRSGPAYGSLPRPLVMATPPLLLGALLHGLHLQVGPLSPHVPYAIGRLMEVLSALTLGQGLERGDPGRAAAVAGPQGLLFALPLWLRHGAAPAPRLAVEGWGRSLATLWELASEAQEGVLGARARLAEAEAALRADWPRLPAFEAGAPFDWRNVTGLRASAEG